MTSASGLRGGGDLSALPKMAAACEDPANHGQGRVLADFAPVFIIAVDSGLLGDD